MKKYICALAVLLSAACHTAAASPLTVRADSAYTAGEFEQAAALYEEAMDQGGVSPSLLYNAGNAAAQAHEYGKAVLYYERGRRLDPSDGDLKANLAYVSSKVEDANRAEMKGKRLNPQPDEPSFFQSAGDWVGQEHSSDFWAVLAAIFFITTLAGAALYMFGRAVTARKIGFFGAICALGVSVVAVVFAFVAAARFNDEETAVLTAYRTELRTEPKQSSPTTAPALTRGTKVRIVAEETDVEGEVTWMRVRLNSDYTGWVPASDVSRVAMQ